MAELVGEGLDLVSCETVVVPQTAVVGGPARSLQVISYKKQEYLLDRIYGIHNISKVGTQKLIHSFERRS